MKEFEVNHEISVKAPVERVFHVWTDFEHWADLYPEVYDSMKVNRQGNTVITEEIIKTIAGKQQAVIHTVLAPPHRYDRNFTEGAMAGTIRITTFEPTPEGTLVKTHMNVKLAGMVATLIGDLAETLFEKNIDKLSQAHAHVAEETRDSEE